MHTEHPRSSLNETRLLHPRPARRLLGSPDPSAWNCRMTRRRSKTEPCKVRQDMPMEERAPFIFLGFGKRAVHL